MHNNINEYDVSEGVWGSEYDEYTIFHNMLLESSNELQHACRVIFIVDDSKKMRLRHDTKIVCIDCYWVEEDRVISGDFVVKVSGYGTLREIVPIEANVKMVSELF